MKKKIGIVVGIIIVLALVFLGGYYFASKNMNSSKSISNKAITQQKPKGDNKIDGFNLGVLTKDEFHKAENLGQKYKNKTISVEGINQKTNGQDVFKQTYGFRFIIHTPYAKVTNTSEELAEQYLDITDKNMIQKIKDEKTDINTFDCMAFIGGDSLEFIKSMHMVLRVYGKNQTKVLQSQNVIFANNGYAEMTDFFPDNPNYMGGIVGTFSAKDVVALEPTKLEIIVIYPDGKEVKQAFDYNTLNQL